MSTPFKGSDIGQFHSYSSKPSDDAYLASIASHQDKKYYNYLLNNPWMFSKQAEFTPTLFQQIGENLFDDFHARNGYYSTLQSNQQQWLSEALERFRQEEYNSPSSQVDRQRAAGLNPDINGGVDSGSAAENDQPISPVDWPGDGVNPLDVVSRIGSFFVKAYSFASGIAKDSLSLKSMNLSNLDKESSIFTNIRSAAESFLRDSITTPHKNDKGEWVFPDLSFDALDSYADGMYKSSRSRKMFKTAVSRAYNSARLLSSQWSDIADAESARTKMADAIGKNLSLGGDSHSSFYNDPLITISEELNSMNLAIQKAQMKFQKDYNENVSGESAADATNKSNQSVSESYDAQKYNREVDKIVNQSINKIIKSLSESAAGSDWSANLAKGLLLLFSAYRSNLLPSLPNMSGMIQNKNFYNTTNNNGVAE